MTIAQTVLKHWYVIGLVAVAAPLAIAFGFINPEQEITNNIPWKYAFALLAALGVYALSQVNALWKKRPTSTSQPRPPARPQDQDDMFNQFGG